MILNATLHFVQVLWPRRASHAVLVGMSHVLLRITRSVQFPGFGFSDVAVVYLSLRRHHL